jgi:signal peptidase II
MKDTSSEQHVSRPFITWAGFAVPIIALLALDLWLKAWAAATLPGEPRVLIEGFLGLRYHRNSGVAFGFLANWDYGRWVIVIVNVLMMGALIWYYAKLPHQRRYWLLRVPMILIVAGGFGNIIDRVWLGYVRDMLEFLFINFAIFNLADVFIVAGVFSAAFVLLFVIKDAPYLN